LPLINIENRQRRQLAGEAENSIRAAFDSDLPDA
jgi:hypothetical protein